jgi:hypothetical protein
MSYRARRLFILCGVVTIFVGSFAFYRNLVTRDWPVTDAQVVSVQQAGADKNHTDDYTLTVRYRIEGREVAGIMEHVSGTPRFAVNQLIPVKVDPENTSHFVFNEPGASVFIASMFGMGTLFLCAGLFLKKHQPGIASGKMSTRSQIPSYVAQSSDLIEYPYKAQTGTLIFALLFFGMLGALLSHAAMTNTRALIIDVVIRLSAGQATMFYWTMAGLSFAMALLSLVGLVRQMAEKEGRILRLTRSELRVPQGLLGKEAHVALADVTNVRLRQVRGQLWLEIIHRHGKVNIAQILLPDAEAFRKVREFLSANTPTGVLGRPAARRASHS